MVYDANDSWIKNREINGASKNYSEIIYKIYGRYLTGKSLLEVGPGEGWNLKTAKENGYDVYGIESSSKNCEYIKKMHGINCINKKFNDRDLGEMRFDNILISHVIEHIEDPREFINSLKRKLSSTGTIIILTPNLCSTWSYLYGSKWDPYYVQDHVSFFCRKHIELLLGTDMQLVYTSTYEAESQYLNMLFRFIDETFLNSRYLNDKDDIHNLKSNSSLQKCSLHLLPAINLFGFAFKALSKSNYGTDLLYVAKRK
jgi:2-polyprenyl-3-methyl-5-hydroxy-6-metoxy-1,4-benzoquinol methylase